MSVNRKVTVPRGSSARALIDKSYHSGKRESRNLEVVVPTKRADAERSNRGGSDRPRACDSRIEIRRACASSSNGVKQLGLGEQSDWLIRSIGARLLSRQAQRRAGSRRLLRLELQNLPEAVRAAVGEMCS